MGSTYQGLPIESNRYIEFFHDCTNYGFLWITVDDVSVRLDAYTLDEGNGAWSVLFNYTVAPEPGIACAALLLIWLRR